MGNMDPLGTEETGQQDPCGHSRDLPLTWGSPDLETQLLAPPLASCPTQGSHRTPRGLGDHSACISRAMGACAEGKVLRAPRGKAVL